MGDTKYIEHTIKLKPLSVNKCWQGRRFKTLDYKKYGHELEGLLPDILNFPYDEKLILYVKWGFSNARADYDNPIKPFQDILQKKYEFDDKWIYTGIIQKELVKKGEEYIYFRIGGNPPDLLFAKILGALFDD